VAFKGDDMMNKYFKCGWILLFAAGVACAERVGTNLTVKTAPESHSFSTSAKYTQKQFTPAVPESYNSVSDKKIIAVKEHGKAESPKKPRIDENEPKMLPPQKEIRALVGSEAKVVTEKIGQGHANSNRPVPARIQETMDHSKEIQRIRQQMIKEKDPAVRESLLNDLRAEFDRGKAAATKDRKTEPLH
jgi:hypothetical protein